MEQEIYDKHTRVLRTREWRSATRSPRQFAQVHEIGAEKENESDKKKKGGGGEEGVEHAESDPTT